MLKYDRIYSKHLDDTFKNTDSMSLQDLKEYKIHLNIESEYLDRRIKQIPNDIEKVDNEIKKLKLYEEKIDIEKNVFLIILEL